MRAFFFAVLLTAGMPVEAGVFGEPGLQQPQQAFRISARALDARTVEVTFAIAEGYYMYRDRFQSKSITGKPLTADISRGEMKDDPYFGPTEILRREVRIPLRVPGADTSGDVEIDVSSQGCADQGVCFLPQTQRVRVSLARREQ